MDSGQHLRRFHGIGERLYRLTPSAFKKTYWALRCGLKRDDFPIQFLVDDPTIPWELMRPVPEDFALGSSKPPDILALTHPVGRWILSYLTNMSPRLKRGTIVVATATKYCGPDAAKENLPDAPGVAEVASMLVNEYQDVTICIDAQYETILSLFEGRLALVRERRPVSVIYLGGHGSYDTKNPDLSVMYLVDQKLSVTDLNVQEVVLGNQDHPLVVLNACHVGAAGLVPGDVGGWAGMLIKRRFGGLVAPLWPVFETSARDAMEDFFRLALGGTKTLGEAVRDVRASRGKDSPTYLAFIYYGDVMGRFPAAPSRPAVVTQLSTGVR